MYCLGQWKTPIITGDRPPPCAYFSIDALPDNRGIIFGGVTIKLGTDVFNRVNDLFLLSFPQDVIVSCLVLLIITTTFSIKTNDDHA